jgi:DNA-binding XRE family transcriptional regulator
VAERRRGGGAVTSNGGSQLIGNRVKTEREGMGLTHEQLGKKVHISRQWIGSIENGQKLPTLQLVVSLWKNLCHNTDPSDQSLAEWILDWVADTASRADSGDIAESVEGALKRARDMLSRRPPAPSGAGRTLLDFPEAFLPLVVVCGDRREVPQRDRGDLFAYNLATTDLMFFPTLGLGPRDVTVRSDKVFVRMDDTYLTEAFGKVNLLVIGSPAVNHAARRINTSSLFRFNFPPRVHTLIEGLRRAKDLNDKTIPQMLVDVTDFIERREGWDREAYLAHKQKLGQPVDQKRLPAVERLIDEVLEQHRPKALMSDLRGHGLLDPVAYTVHALYTRQDNDFGLISVAPNPFARAEDAESDNYISIVVGGIHGPGTAHAVRMLGERHFADHPYGGVVEVELDLDQSWPGRMENATVKWQTRPYDRQQLVANLKKVQEPPGTALEHLTDEQRKTLLKLINNLAGTEGR